MDVQMGLMGGWDGGNEPQHRLGFKCIFIIIIRAFLFTKPC